MSVEGFRHGDGDDSRKNHPTVAAAQRRCQTRTASAAAAFKFAARGRSRQAAAVASLRELQPPPHPGLAE